MNARASTPALLAALIFLVGCETYTASDPDVDRPIFDRVWYDADTDWGGFQSIVVHPVKIETLDMRNQLSTGLQASRNQTLDMVKTYTQQQIARATDGTASAETGPGTLVIEAMLVEFRPTGVRAGSVTIDAEIQFEARMRDGADGRVLATFLDKKTAGSDRAFQEKTWELRARRTINRWCSGLGGALPFMEDGTLESSAPFDFRRW